MTIGSRTAQVMQPQLGVETRIPLNVAGPATLAVNPATRGNITISYTFDPVSAVDSKLANISTRGLVETGDNVLIGGFYPRPGVEHAARNRARDRSIAATSG